MSFVGIKIPIQYHASLVARRLLPLLYVRFTCCVRKSVAEIYFYPIFLKGELKSLSVTSLRKGIDLWILLISVLSCVRAPRLPQKQRFGSNYTQFERQNNIFEPLCFIITIYLLYQNKNICFTTVVHHWNLVKCLNFKGRSLDF